MLLFRVDKGPTLRGQEKMKQGWNRRFEPKVRGAAQLEGVSELIVTVGIGAFPAPTPNGKQYSSVAFLALWETAHVNIH